MYDLVPTLGSYISFAPFKAAEGGQYGYITRKPIGTRARTGETCPESGVWKVEGTPSTTAPIAKGNRMPPYDGRAVIWVLTRYA